MRPPYLHEIGSKTVKRCVARQPVLTRYKPLEIEQRTLSSRVYGYTQPALEGRKGVPTGVALRQRLQQCLGLLPDFDSYKYI